MEDVLAYLGSRRFFRRLDGVIPSEAILPRGISHTKQLHGRSLVPLVKARDFGMTPKAAMLFTRLTASA